MLPEVGLRKDAVRLRVFEDYIRDHVDSWYSFARRRRLDHVERMEDLILVTGCTLVTSWGVAVFVDSGQDAEVMLWVRGTIFDWREISPSVIYQNSHPVCPHSQYHRSHLLNAFSVFESMIHVKTIARSSEVFEQSASFRGPDSRAQQSHFLMILITSERMSDKKRESRIFRV
jgi:hypothetical protein